MKPLIKWPGGKTREIDHIKGLIPKEYNRYIEPFIGGGAVFFHLNSERNVINDVDKNLMTFYSNVKNQNPQFLEMLDNVKNDWSKLYNLVEVILEKFHSSIIETKSSPKLTNGILKEKTEIWLKKLYYANELKLFINNSSIFYSFLLTSISSKIYRIAKLEIKHTINFGRDKNAEHLESAIRAAYYTMLRDTECNDKNERNVRFFFIREFCYGSMFRYNSNGKFNIPYGGINYNKKEIGVKIDHLRSKEVIELLSHTEVFSEDFESFFKKVKPQKEDFIFFDPPYDSDFKDYGKNPFTFDDQIRLANIIANLPSKIVMIINKSDRINNLYLDIQESNPNIEITDYEKIYTYNVRGRNNRQTQHLLITNFPQESLIKKELEQFFA